VRIHQCLFIFLFLLFPLFAYSNDSIPMVDSMVPLMQPSSIDSTKNNDSTLVSNVRTESKSNISVNVDYVVDSSKSKKYEERAIKNSLISIHDAANQLNVSTNIKIAGIILGVVGAYFAYNKEESPATAFIIAGAVSYPISLVVEKNAYINLMKETEQIKPEYKNGNLSRHDGKTKGVSTGAKVLYTALAIVAGGFIYYMISQ